MSGFLLDTNVISMLAPSRAEASAGFLEWLERTDNDGMVFLSVVTVHEIEKGIGLLEHRGSNAKAAALRAWLGGLISTYDDKILGLDIADATMAGQLEAKAIADGHSPGMADATIAGIAKSHGLTVVTENTKHFVPFGVDVLSPKRAADML